MIWHGWLGFHDQEDHGLAAQAKWLSQAGAQQTGLQWKGVCMVLLLNASHPFMMVLISFTLLGLRMAIHHLTLLLHSTLVLIYHHPVIHLLLQD